MNIVKLQQEIIKDYLNNKRAEWYIQIKESEVYIMSRTQVFILSPKEFVLDIDKLGLPNTNIADSLIKSAKDAKPAIKTCIKSVISQGKDINCLEIKREDNGYNKEDIELNRKAMYNKAIDDFANKFISLCYDGEFMARFNEFPATTLLEMAECCKLKFNA